MPTAPILTDACPPTGAPYDLVRDPRLLSIPLGKRYHTVTRTGPNLDSYGPGLKDLRACSVEKALKHAWFAPNLFDRVT